MAETVRIAQLHYRLKYLMIRRVLGLVAVCALVTGIALLWRRAFIDVSVRLGVSAYDSYLSSFVVVLLSIAASMISILATLAFAAMAVWLTAHLSVRVQLYWSWFNALIAHWSRRWAKYVEERRGLNNPNEPPSLLISYAFGDTRAAHLSREYQTEKNLLRLAQGVRQVQQHRKQLLKHSKMDAA